jgi:hypothetical protein
MDCVVESVVGSIYLDPLEALTTAAANRLTPKRVVKLD